MRVLVFSSLYPNAAMPLHGIFVRRRLEAWARRPGNAITVIAPVPYFPKLPFKTRPHWDRFARVPALEAPWGYDIHHPRHLVTPALGMRFYGRWMAQATLELARELHRKTPFDLIDGHYIYPDGEAAIALGRELKIPVVLSSRGTDLNLYPELPHIRPLLQDSLARAAHVICVCRELGRVASDLGVDAQRLSIIGNGIDAGRFQRQDAKAARQKLGLPQDVPLLLSVGHLTERKGFHLLIEALALNSAAHPQAHLVIVGDGPQRAELQGLIARLGLGARVHLAGAIHQDELPPWYAAADLFLLASSREGWPNVLCEAQACGVPAVATNAWGIGEILHEPELGLLVQERSAPAIAQAMAQALSRPWNRTHIAEVGGRRTWDTVAEEVDRVFQSVR